jgi:ubiquitin-conjugating enzyme E2 variant
MHEKPAGYTRAFRFIEVASITTFAALLAWLGWRLAPHARAAPMRLALAMVCAYLAADLVSGLVHWMGDTWGSPDTPLLGPALIRPFREHHEDQKAMTRHDFVETNGANCMIALPAAVAAVLIPLDDGPWQAPRQFGAMFFGALIVWVMATNQIHKWAHTDEPPALVRLLQGWRLILHPGHHAVHHRYPFDRYYCITTGWLNWPLSRLRFFRGLEVLVTAVTGLRPAGGEAIGPGAEPRARASGLG